MLSALAGLHWDFIIISSLFTLVSSDCNPLASNTQCPPVLGFQSDYSVDFTSVSEIPYDWIIADYENVTLGPNGAEFTFAKRYDAPYMWTAKYMFFGHVEVVMKCATGTGIISSAVLLSDDLDEIDYEFSGNNFAKGQGTAQTNYFGKGVIGNSGRGTYPAVADPTEDFHTWTFDWSPSQLSWGVDGQNLRTLNAADCQNYTGAWFQYPQTPARLHLGLWDAGDADVAGGTVYWAGGYTDLSQAPFTMYVKSVKIKPMYPGYAYNYTNLTATWPGQWKNIQIVNTTSNPTFGVAGPTSSILAPTTIKPILNPSGVTSTTTSGATAPSNTTTMISSTPFSSNIPTSRTSIMINASSTASSGPSSSNIQLSSTQLSRTGVISTFSTPTPIQANMVPNCNVFYQVQAGDDCGTISQKCGISEADFKTWNPDVGVQCYNLWLNYYACVGVGNNVNSGLGTSNTSTAQALGPSNAIISSSPTPFMTSAVGMGNVTTISVASVASLPGTGLPIGSYSTIQNSVSSPTSSTDSSSSLFVSGPTEITFSSNSARITSSTTNPRTIGYATNFSSVPDITPLNTLSGALGNPGELNPSGTTALIVASVLTMSPSNHPSLTSYSTTVSSNSLGQSTLTSLSPSSSTRLVSLSNTSYQTAAVSHTVSGFQSGQANSMSSSQNRSSSASYGVQSPSTSLGPSLDHQPVISISSTSSVNRQVSSTILPAIYVSQSSSTVSPTRSTNWFQSSSVSNLSSTTLKLVTSSPSIPPTLKMSTSVKPVTSFGATLYPSISILQTPTGKSSAQASSNPAPTSNGSKSPVTSTCTDHKSASTSPPPPPPTQTPINSNAWLDWLRSVAPGLDWRLCSNNSSWSFLRC